MPRIKAFSALSEMIDTDMEDDTLNADAFPTPDSNQENVGPSKKKGGRPKAAAKKFTKPKRSSGGTGISRVTAAPKAKVGRKRAPLREQTSAAGAEETEEVDEFAAQTEGETAMDDLAEKKQIPKQKAPARKKGRAPKKEKDTVNATAKDGEFEYTPRTLRQINCVSTIAPGRSKGPKCQPSTELQQQEKVIQETQAPMDVDVSRDAKEDDADEDALPQSVFRHTNNGRATSHKPQHALTRRRAGSASDAEKTAGDPATRRKLGEMTRKFENLETKYKMLRETGGKEAEANFEKLKTQSEVKAKAASELIISLKKELATQKALAQESRSIQKQIASRDSDLSKTQALADQLSTSLSEAQNENKALQAKLANSRSASMAVESLGSKTPGSAIKGKTQAQARTLMVGSAEAAHAAQVAQLKEDLYSDLTGLILRGVERNAEADTYDCIQTGRNGTLHFKLSVAKEAEESYENTEFQYVPRLDRNRDRDLIALMPDYLTDEITFARTHAAMFYGRVVETLTKRRMAEEQE